MVLASLWNLGADTWTAIATWVGAVVALVAAGVAGTVGLRQLSEARTLRLEESQPYVIVVLEESGIGAHHYDLVIRNTGKTPAHGVKVVFDQPLESATLGPQFSPVPTPDEISILVPGQEWRTFWDWAGKRREDGNLPMRYAATVRFQDSQKREFGPFEFVLDWDLLVMRGAIDVSGLHVGMQALKEIAQHFKQFKP